ncbi:cellulase family glycosylhydrolase [Aurantimonas sp. HBX-1]|uniref:cellulase family glycosylhydrolase n=1 Tax=Aurantimonas sp. HBX-1 TaxID=2906072 RepID=UPI001F24E017|nr:cellulase family glycosylhydrolase [Aurantimonas sp. HBX-1]UIJ74129.1 glycoside hydrolase family 5 protein [Aurantimonas sp. HBX-1]
MGGARLTLGGEDVALRGVAVGDPLLVRAARPVNDYALLRRDWGSNTVRLSVHPGLWRREPRRMMDALEQEVVGARSEGQFVIIDWHAIGWPDGKRFEPEPGWGLPADAYDCDLALAGSFWEIMAIRFGADQGVMFELWNEPVRLENSRVPSPWGRDWAELRPIFGSLVARVRKYAANLVLATGGNFASDLTGIAEDPLDDGNTAYSWHVYPSTVAGGFSELDRLLAGLPENRPVIVTEWGFGGRETHLRGDAAGFGETFLRQFIEARGLHWTAWCWHPEWTPALIEPDWETPTQYGHWIKETMLRYRGRFHSESAAYKLK